VQVAVCDVIRSHDNLSSFLSVSCLSIIKLEEKRKVTKDKWRDHGAVNKPSSEQQFCKYTVITFVK